MQLAPIPQDEHARLESLYSLHLLDTPEEERFDLVTRLAADVFQVPIAFVSLIDVNRQWLKSRVGVEICETTRDVSFCSHAILNDEPLVVPDTHKDPRFAENPLVTGEPFLRFYAGHPLRGPQGAKVGTFCILDRRPREFGVGQMQTFKNLASIVERELNLGDLLEAQSKLLETQRKFLKTQQRLQKELADAGRYVRSLLPQPVQKPMPIDWRFMPSESLGGDCFGYHDLGDGRLAFYLLDVCGHGVGAALLSVTLLDRLRSQTLAGVDFANPASVLSELNHEFQMTRHGNMFFTIWYGVLDCRTRQLTYSSAGHPPALLIGTDGSVSRLTGNGIATGIILKAAYVNMERTLQPGETLYVYSDGASEVFEAGGTLMPFAQFKALLARAAHHSPGSLDLIVEGLRRWSGTTVFRDDVSILELRVT